MTENELLTVIEASVFVGVAVGAVYKRIDAKKLAKTVRFGKILVARVDVLEWKKEREAEARAILK
jgi:hypothetical protein